MVSLDGGAGPPAVCGPRRYEVISGALDTHKMKEVDSVSGEDAVENDFCSAPWRQSREHAGKAAYTCDVDRF